MYWLNNANTPVNPDPLASKFADWVYENSNTNSKKIKLPWESKHHLMKLGKIAHEDIDLFFSLKWAQEKLKEGTASDWKIIFTDRKAKNGKIFHANSLQINGESMRCVPDAVLEHKYKNKILIIERKTTYVPSPKIPVDGWPNVQAQLWCYSWIDDWLDFDEVILVSQLWYRYKGGLTLCHDHPMWKRDDERFHTQCVSWFAKYGGKFSLFKRKSHNK